MSEQSDREKVLECVRWLDDDDVTAPYALGACKVWAAAIRRLEASAAQPVEPSVEERLERCRDRAAAFIATLLPLLDVDRNTKVADMIHMAEDCAHEMLAAARPAQPKADAPSCTCGPIRHMLGAGNHADGCPSFGPWQEARKASYETGERNGALSVLVKWEERLKATAGMTSEARTDMFNAIGAERARIEMAEG